MTESKVKLRYKGDENRCYPEGSDEEQELSYALTNNEVKGSAQIKELLATIPGENDGADWHWLVSLENGNIAYLRGRCDYTGWD